MDVYNGYVVIGPPSSLDGGVRVTGSAGPYQIDLTISPRTGIHTQFGGRVGPFSANDEGVSVSVPSPVGTVTISSDGTVSVGREIGKPGTLTAGVDVWV